MSEPTNANACGNKKENPNVSDTNNERTSDTESTSTQAAPQQGNARCNDVNEDITCGSESRLTLSLLCCPMCLFARVRGIQLYARPKTNYKTRLRHRGGSRTLRSQHMYDHYPSAFDIHIYRLTIYIYIYIYTYNSFYYCFGFVSVVAGRL